MTIHLFHSIAEGYIPMWSLQIQEQEYRNLRSLELRVKGNIQELLYRVATFNEMLKVLDNIKCTYTTNKIDRIIIHMRLPG